MMLKKILIVIALSTIMCSAKCADNGSKGALNKINEKRKSKKSNELKKKTKSLIQLKFEITKDDKKKSSPKIVTLDGHQCTIRMVKEKYFPSSWEAPVLEKSNSMTSIPSFDKATDIGLSISIFVKLINNPSKKEIIFACGKISFTNDSKFKKIVYPEFKHTGIQYSIKSNITSFMLYFVDTNEQEIRIKDGNSLYKVKIFARKVSESEAKSDNVKNHSKRIGFTEHEVKVISKKQKNTYKIKMPITEKLEVTPKLK